MKKLFLIEKTELMYPKIKVICIHSRSRDIDGGYRELIVGNVYDAEVITTNSYMVNGWWEKKDDFITLSQHRDKQLESLEIN
jgi:hypothetical protein